MTTAAARVPESPDARMATHSVPHHETPLCRTAASYKLLGMPHTRLPQHTAFRLVLLGVDAHAVSDIHCR